MSEHENIQKLLRLKKYETPGEEYFDNFLDELKERQRQDALKLSTFELMKERIGEWYEDLGHAKWAVPAGSMAALMATIFALSGEEQISSTELPGSDVSKVGAESLIELQLPKNQEVPMAVPPGNRSVLPAGFGGLREL